MQKRGLQRYRWYFWVGVAVALFAVGATIDGSYYESGVDRNDNAVPSREDVLGIAT